MHKIIKILLLSIFIVSCRNSDSGDTTLQVNLILRDTFSQESSSFIQGEAIEFFLTATNTTNKPITLTFGSAQQYDFYITSTLGTEVWRWSADKVFAAVITQLIIPAQSTVEATETWDQTLMAGGNIPIGNYTAFGSFKDQSPIAQFSFSVQ